ncbi:zinc finger HIT domain-containing protein 3 [Pogona vitticeps]
MERPAGGCRCVVCGKGGRSVAKYRCPACRERYCSVSCCKKHKDHCRPKADLHPQPANTDAPQSTWREKSLDAEGSPWSVDDILTEEDDGDKVPLQKLQLLEESEELRGILGNPHLRQLLLSVDRAEDKNALLKTCMQEPLFVEFADCCLRTVEPPEGEGEELPG